jgi:D-amino-acid oxidase
MKPMPLNRRGFLNAFGLFAAGSALSAAGRGLQPSLRQTPGTPAGEHRLARVRVSDDRVIRTVAGLRPFRPSGFVVAAEKLDHKVVIHNYGHGGGGITLSWGTAALAVEEVLKIDAARRTRSRCAVLGCGVIGLATARTLQRKGYAVTIYARDLPPETTSNIAGGLWFPASVYDNEDDLSPAFKDQFTRACRLSQRMFQNLVGDYYGVRWVEHFVFFRQRPTNPGHFPGGNDLYPETKLREDPDRFFGFPYARQTDTMLIEPPVYLNALMREFYLAGGKIVVREFKSKRQLVGLAEPVIVNCTGLGARALFGDEELEPDKGQLTILLPQPEIDYTYVAAGSETLYMFPRRDGIVLGGTNDHGNWSLEPDPEETRRILRGHTEIQENGLVKQ